MAASGHGDLLRFQNLSGTLGEDHTLHMLQPPTGGLIASINDLAHLYADRIQAHGETRVYLAGFSVGGVSALETALHLQRRGIQVCGLFLIDTVYPRRVIGRKAVWNTLRWLAKHLHLQDLSMNGRRLEAMFGDPGLVAQVTALASYQPNAFDGPTVLIKSTGLASWDRLLFRPWRKLLGSRLSEEEIPGLHGSIFETSCVHNLARSIKAHITRDGSQRALARTVTPTDTVDAK
jgi:thioesterase domain-containing protein